jgi:hypothetical protein
MILVVAIKLGTSLLDDAEEWYPQVLLTNVLKAS